MPPPAGAQPLDRVSPHFFGAERLADPGDERTRDFLERIVDEVRVVRPAA